MKISSFYHLLVYMTFIFFSSHAFSNVRVIGNGGGEAEMKTLSLFSELVSGIEVRLNTENLLDSDFDILNSTVQSFNHVKSKLAITFGSHPFDCQFAPKTNVFSIDLNKMKGQFSGHRQLLFNCILNFDKSFDQFIPQQKLNYLYNLVFFDSNWELTTVQLGMGQVIVLHQAKGSSAVYKIKDIFTNLNFIIQKASGCQPQNFLLKSITNILRRPSGFLSNVVWLCQNQEWSGQAQLRTSPEGNWSARIFGVH